MLEGPLSGVDRGGPGYGHDAVMGSTPSMRERGGWGRWSNRRAPNLWRAVIDRASLAWKVLLLRIFNYFISHPMLFRAGFALLRIARPIAVIRSTVLLAKARDVVDVLARIDDFTVAEFLAPKMPWGQFLLNLDGREQHARERQILDGVGSDFRDGERLRALISDAAKHPMPTSGRLDVVKDVCEPVVLRIACDYFGVPRNHGPSEMMRMMADLGSIVMLEPAQGSRRWNEIRDHIDEFTTRLEDEVRARWNAAQAGRPGGNDLLGRLVEGMVKGCISTDPSFARRYVTGVTTAGTATIVRAATHAIDRLLAHPAALKAAQELATALTDAIAAAADPTKPAEEQEAAKASVERLRPQLLQVAYEALRFRPMLPLLVRYCPRDVLLAKGTTDARMARAGAQVIAAPIAAMFDPERFPQPSKFCSDRPLESYVHFGVGPRKCFGKYVVDIALVEIVRTVLLLRGLKRASGSQGRISYEGPVPRSLVVTFEAASRMPKP
jgi:cytochrome P450